MTLLDFQNQHSPLIPYLFSIRLVRVGICSLSEHTLHLYYDQNTMAKTKRKNNDLQNITYKIKDRVTRTPLKTGGDFSWFLNCYITETTTI